MKGTRSTGSANETQHGSGENRQPWRLSDRSSFIGSSGSGLVQSSVQYPVGNLYNSVVLNCKFVAVDSKGNAVSNIAITWAYQGGIVFKYASKVNQLQNQLPQFKSRASLFPNDIINGNASLMLNNVQLNDQGAYQCTVSTSAGSGDVTVNLRVAAYSAPVFKTSNAMLIATAQTWYPLPTVQWTNFNGTVISTSLNSSANSAGIYKITTVLPSYKQDDNYGLTIQNNLVVSVCTVIVTDSGITANNNYQFNGAILLLPYWSLTCLHFPILLHWILS
ncbi:V-set domain-containing T-cell activation inhibitor 1-like isoform X1 [Erpetoichthys calabaricus]|uniref:V-set domain-containing T-cell activation inhibitor 1-like isoform X1 n=1 Tax=Erpetoichthys calabaricus TaxID=27687 RepID=UPI0022346631|nr:V-set domain-containing T-cell activation inhibitor 1-like isoform X1 [Erpetoichthys calabaricus]